MLAYVNEIPQEDLLAEFIQVYTNECMLSGIELPADVIIHNPQHIISVYDEKELVGIGCLEEAMNIHVRPSYKHREIESTVCKLLQAESKFILLQG